MAISHDKKINITAQLSNKFIILKVYSNKLKLFDYFQFKCF
jgi:hypothetical protein